MQLTTADVGKFFRTRGGWRAKIIHHRSVTLSTPKEGPWQVLVVHKPGEAQESSPVWQDATGLIKDKWSCDTAGMPCYGMHVADLVEEMKD